MSKFSDAKIYGDLLHLFDQLGVALHDTRTASEFSAGFVSLGAALLLASTLFLQLVRSGSRPVRGTWGR
jgi:hypothetical protein